jgi:hypothetical protein
VTIRRAALIAAILLLAACSGGDKPPPDAGTPAPSSAPQPSGGGFFTDMFGSSAPVSCPRVEKIGEAAQLTRFAPSGHDLTDVLFEAEIGDINGKCSGSEGSVTVKLTVDFVASRGPADKNRKAPFSFFVAITDLHEKVLARQQFDSVIEFAGNQTRGSLRENLDQIIPTVKGQRGDDFRIYVGFALTHEELDYNRAHPK